MRYFLIRMMLLTLAWAVLQGSFSLVNLLIGAILSIVLLWFLRPLYEDTWSSSEPVTFRSTVEQAKQFFWVIELLAYFVYELVLSSVQVAAAVLRPNMRLTPGVVALPLDAKSDLEITVLANLISLTPGTLSLEVAPDKTKLYIHSMFVEGEEAAETSAYIKRTLERRVIRALGRRKGPG